MSAWNSIPSADGNPGSGQPRRRSIGTTMGLVFGATAVVTVALGTIFALMQRTEHVKLRGQVAEAESKIEEMHGRIAEAGRAASVAREARRLAETTLDDYRAGAERDAARWKEELAALQAERESLQNQLDESKTEEERLAEGARQSLHRSDVFRLKVAGAEGACIDSKTTFRESVDVLAIGGQQARVSGLSNKAAQAAMRARGTPLSPKDFSAYISISAISRDRRVGNGIASGIAIEVSLMTPMVSSDLKFLRWAACMTDSDIVVSDDAEQLLALLELQIGRLVDNLLERAANGGSPGKLAAQQLPTPAKPGTPARSGSPAGPAPAPPPGTPP